MKLSGQNLIEGGKAGRYVNGCSHFMLSRCQPNTVEFGVRGFAGLRDPGSGNSKGYNLNVRITQQ